MNMIKTAKEYIEDILKHKDQSIWDKKTFDAITAFMESYAKYYHKSKVNNSVLDDARCSTFTKDELKVIKVDILHIFDKITLSHEETHKRNLILNKLKKELGDEYYT